MSPRTRTAGPGTTGAAHDVTGAGEGRRDALQGLLREMLRIRRFEEKCAELYSATKIRGFLHLCVGEEAVAVGVVGAVGPDDAIVSTYREHGHALARGVPMVSVMAEMFGRATGCSRGRGGSMHLFDVAHRFYGGNAIVAGGLPLALGLALADHLTADPAVTACIFGDGAFAEGEFHETANLAALWRLPLLLCCENNRYAMGTALAREHAATDLALRAASYGLVAWSVDGMDVVAVRDATDRAVAYVRNSGRPCLLELRTYRFRSHSMYDPDRYRDKAEIEGWRSADPIPALGNRLVSEGLMTQEALARWTDEAEASIAAEIDAAIAAAETAPLEPVADLLRDLTTPPGGAGQPAGPGEGKGR